MKRGKKILMLWLLIFMTVCSGVFVHAKTTAPAKTAAIELILHKSSGSVFKKYTIKSGLKKLPSMKNPSGCTFLGWSTKKNQTTDPKYTAGQVLKVTKTTHLYPVIFKRKSEPDLEPCELPVLSRRKYSKIIFVGDSRTVKMRATLEQQCNDDFLSRISFVAKSGKGLSWFKEEGYAMLKQKIADMGSYSKRKPIAVVFNLGVNDLRSHGTHTPNCDAVIRNYAEYLNKIAKTLNSKNCRLFYMSVNPVNSGMMPYQGVYRREEDIRYFNKGLQNALSSRFTFLDTHTRLTKYGYGTNNDVYGDMFDDGIHYSMKTYKRIYKFCIDKIVLAS